MLNVVMDTYGLAGNTIYDIVQFDPEGILTSPSVWFNVTCKNINGLRQTSSGYTSKEDGSLTYSFAVDPNLDDIEISPGALLLEYHEITLTILAKHLGH